jgi:hypothetical protein
MEKEKETDKKMRSEKSTIYVINRVNKREKDTQKELMEKERRKRRMERKILVVVI